MPVNTRGGRFSTVILLAAFVALRVPPAVSDDVYKSVDAQGHVVYSDRPSSGARKTEVDVQQADPAEAQRLAKERLLLKAEDAQRKKQESLANQAKAQQQHDRQVRCQRAKDEYAQLKDAGRIYKLDSDGNRVYYTDAEAETRREAARQVMLTACGN